MKRQNELVKLFEKLYPTTENPHKTVVAVSATTAKRLEKRLNISFLDGVDSIKFKIVKNNNHLINKGIIYNNSEGKFFIGDPKAPDEENQPIRTGRLFKILLSRSNFSEAKIKQLVELWESYYKLPEIKVTDNIEWLYNEDHSSKGTIGKSCMTGCGSYYSELKWALGGKLKAAYMELSGEIVGRALVWECDSIELGSVTFMDRIYSATPAIENAFKRFAAKNGWIFKAEQSFNNLTDFIVNGEEMELTLQIKVSDLDLSSQFPYLDTFRYLNDMTSHYIISNTIINDEKCYYFERTDGGLDGYSDQVWSGILGTYILGSGAIYLDYYDDYLPAEEVERVEIDREVFYIPTVRAGEWVTIIDSYNEKFTIPQELFEEHLENEYIYIDAVYNAPDGIDYISYDMLYWSDTLAAYIYLEDDEGIDDAVQEIFDAAKEGDENARFEIEEFVTNSYFAGIISDSLYSEMVSFYEGDEEDEEEEEDDL
jgi:hypothetical protein